jgi:uncharacterized hydrophobic protein (TIGR00341 family)
LKRIEVTVDTEHSENIKKAFEELQLAYICSTCSQREEDVIVYSALIPDELVDKAIEDFSKNMDMRIRENTISVYNVEAFVSTVLEKVKEKVVKTKPPVNPLEKLVASTDRNVRLNRDIVLMALFATLIAMAGLFLDNVAIVIGAMLLSPLLGPINAFAVNANLGRVRQLLTSQLSILSLLGSVIALSAGASFTISRFVTLPLYTNQIAIRMTASPSDIGIALVLGLAGGLALFAAIPELLVGVAIAVALVPPATVTGIGIAFAETRLFIGALVLTLVYLVGLQLGSTLMLRIRGVTPRKYYQKAEARKKFAYSIAILAVLFVILGIAVFLLNL